MKLYHGSNVVVAEPRILPPRPGHTLVDQLLFHTEKALAHLRFTGSEVVNVRQ